MPGVSAWHIVGVDGGTEPRGVTQHLGGWDDHFPGRGRYLCRQCGAVMYDAEHKFDCGCGWPGFYRSAEGAGLKLVRDADDVRTEVKCGKCGIHLGHVFYNEAFDNPPPNERHCINSVVLSYCDGGTVKEATYDGPVFAHAHRTSLAAPSVMRDLVFPGDAAKAGGSSWWIVIDTTVYQLPKPPDTRKLQWLVRLLTCECQCLLDFEGTGKHCPQLDDYIRGQPFPYDVVGYSDDGSCSEVTDDEDIGIFHTLHFVLRQIAS
ncbi:Peptide methionine sulfoxide reductase B3 [Perkinsus olseni]|uniref:Peptide methionine sulfoxide reductase B3 n=1 Tax=Perkinsus olseni TaxID=32597 RepID=A0A7J6LDU0_PEROL|nr:Peptide methionine sulfoxide reductase B3 [Perkinsus olseni]